MYLVRPTQLLWTVLAHKSPEQIVEMGGDLERIDDWKVADRPVYDSDIALALRYGNPASTGLVVDAGYILTQERPRELREVHAKAKEAQQHPTIKQTDDFIDQHLAPGWKAQGEELDRKIDEDVERSVRSAEAKAKRQLEMPMKQELIAHWRSLGGHVPHEAA